MCIRDRLAYIHRVRTKTVLYVFDLETGAEHPIYDGLSKDQMETWATFGVYPGFQWTPDGKSVVIWAKGKIVRVDIAKKTAANIPFKVHSTQRITDAVRFAQDVSPANFEARMIRQGVTTPNDKTLVFSAVGHLWQKSLPNGVPKRLTEDTDFEYWPSFSRDGKSIVYTTWNDTEGGRVCRISAGGGGKKVLTKRAGFYRAPAFSPDGKMIVFERNDGSVRLGTNNGTDPGLYTICL